MSGETDGNQAATQSSGDHHGSEAQKSSSSHSVSPSPELREGQQSEQNEENDHGAGLAEVGNDTTAVHTPKLAHAEPMIHFIPHGATCENGSDWGRCGEPATKKTPNMRYVCASHYARLPDMAGTEPRLNKEEPERYSCAVIQNTLRDVRGSLLQSSENDDYLRGVLDACNEAIEAFNESDEFGGGQPNTLNKAGSEAGCDLVAATILKPPSNSTQVGRAPVSAQGLATGPMSSAQKSNSSTSVSPSPVEQAKEKMRQFIDGAIAMGGNIGTREFSADELTEAAINELVTAVSADAHQEIARLTRDLQIETDTSNKLAQKFAAAEARLSALQVMEKKEDKAFARSDHPSVTRDADPRDDDRDGSKP